MRYELIYILPGSLAEADLTVAAGKVDTLLGRLEIKAMRKDTPVKLKIAYPMKNERYGYFMRAELEGATSSAAKLNSEIQLIPELLRAQVMNLTREKVPGPTTLISHEEANARARELARTAAAHRAAPAPVMAPTAPAAPAIKLTEAQIEEKIEKILQEDAMPTS